MFGADGKAKPAEVIEGDVKPGAKSVVRLFVLGHGFYAGGRSKLPRCAPSSREVGDRVEEALKGKGIDANRVLLIDIELCHQGLEPELARKPGQMYEDNYPRDLGARFGCMAQGDREMVEWADGSVIWGDPVSLPPFTMEELTVTFKPQEELSRWIIATTVSTIRHLAATIASAAGWVGGAFR